MQPLRHNHQVGKTHVVSRSFWAKEPWETSAAELSGASQGCSLVLLCFYHAPFWEVSIRNENDQADRTISTGKLQALPLFHTRPINVVVFHGSQGILVLRWVSRLDAFSGYPVRI